jgi:rhodanese-related sulfurtransferase
VKLFCFLAAFVLFVSFGTHASASDTLSPSAAHRYLRTHPSAVLLDIRRPSEYAAGHIAGARNMNFYDEHFADSLSTLPRRTPVLVYCATGRRSASALHVLDSLGFRTAYHIRGGIVAWKKSDFAVVP